MSRTFGHRMQERIIIYSSDVTGRACTVSYLINVFQNVLRTNIAGIKPLIPLCAPEVLI